MPHYRDGTLAKVGDVVKGKGYNLKMKMDNQEILLVKLYLLLQEKNVT